MESPHLVDEFPALFGQALERRAPLFVQLAAEGTDSYRLFHGAAEGIPGLTIDRYGPLVLVQSFREPLNASERDGIEEALRRTLLVPFEFAYNHRGKTAAQGFELWHEPSPSSLVEVCAREFGVNFAIRARHAGIDPWLFLDLRAGRRYLRSGVNGKSVLNLFCYTGSVGIGAAAAGASEVWNVDFSAGNLAVAKRNIELNPGTAGKVRLIQEDCIPLMRQLGGLAIGGRGNRADRVQKFDRREFDFVVLDPPAWSKGAFGAVDVVGDYASLFKPAVLATRPQGGQIIATHHVPSVPVADWISQLKRCAEKAGRPLRNVQVLMPESDFPSFDGQPPLKIAICEV